eukprot:2980460-Lingulodinium_polyedra.AAC.1
MRGTNTASGGRRALRICLPLHMAVGILEHAHSPAFVGNAGAVECQLRELKYPHHAVWFAKQPSTQMIWLTDLNSTVVHCKVIELPLNFHN